MRKRLAASIGLAAALLSLTACRSSPAVAAYVGNTAITEQRVTDVQNSTVVPVDTTGAKSEPIDRRSVVETLVLLQTCEDHRAKNSFEPRSITSEQVVGTLPAPKDPAQGEEWAKNMADTEFVALRGKMLACVFAMPTTPATPTDAELRDIYDKALAAGAVGPGITFEQIAPQIKQDQQVATQLAVKHELDKLFSENDVTVNPRYGELPFPLLSFQNGPALEVSMGQPNEVVQDR
ncbi:hypothetical protein Rhe02_80020 [Rhizocola hellebori]|uniref:Lipoprotein n=1 Tax=Rhizocola hellebori TaxID=1392758 RepID=A0A8J3QHS0_9ACTN|nr:hypothetical protein [Rhizocola hellebori]GIH09935.1 hypothetical protein Rhe02_80020 [Rhizocola hellebori]